MPLPYNQPETELARELREVARDAIALEGALAGLNFELPSDFPRSQLVEICQSLAQLPSGTGEGCHPALAYARNRLPAIRREHLISEELDLPATEIEAAPPVVRGELIDERLRHLIASVTTALDEYRRLAAAEEPIDEMPEAGVTASGAILEGVVAQSEQLDRSFEDATKEITATANPVSKPADDLRRQINDSQGLNRLARAELRMPSVIVSWYRRVVEALKEYPALIANTANELKVGADIAEICLDRWHDFHKNATTFLIGEFREMCDALIGVAKRLDERKRRRIEVSATPELEFNLETARAMILAGRVPPAHWIPSITELSFGTRRLRDLTPLAALTDLRTLRHVATRVNDLAPLAGLTNLELLELMGTKVSDLTPLAALTNLKSLNVARTLVGDLRPLMKLSRLQWLNASSSNIVDVSPLAALTELTSLYLQYTNVVDVSPLATLTHLYHLSLQSSNVQRVPSLARIGTLNLHNTPVFDVSPLAASTMLRELNLSNTAVSDISPLASLTNLRRLNIRGTRVTSVSALAHIAGLSIEGSPAR
jgi:Leucine-rich repeat (LRR) protein